MFLARTLALALLCPLAHADVQRLSGPFQPSTNAGDVVDHVVSPDGQWVAYVADGEVDGSGDLYAIPTTGGAALLLSAPLTPFTRVRDVHFTSDSQRVVFVARTAATEADLVYSATLDGSGPVPISPVPTSPSFDTVRIDALTPDGSKVVYRENFDLWIGNVDGSTPAAPVPGPFSSASGIVVSPDSQYVAFRGGVPGSSSAAFTARTDLSTPAVEIVTNEPNLKTSTIAGITPDSTRVIVTTFEPFVAGPGALFSAPIDGSAPAVRLNPATAGTSLVSDVNFSPDGSTAYFLHSVEGVLMAPVDGSAPATTITPHVGTRLLLADGGNRLVYQRSTEVGVYSMPPVENAALTLLSVRHNGPVTDLQVSPDGSWASWEQAEEYHVGPVDGSSASVVVTTPFLTKSSYHLPQFSGDSSALLWSTDAPVRVVAADVDGSAAARLLSPAEELYVSAEILSVSAALDRAFFTADLDITNTVELYSASYIGAPDVVRHSAPLNPIGAADVSQFELSDDGELAMFVCNENELPPTGPMIVGSPDEGPRTVLTVPTDGSAPPTEIASFPPKQLQGAKLSRDGAWVVYLFTKPSQNMSAIHARRADGSGPPITLYEAVSKVNSWCITPDSTTVVYHRNVGGLHSVPITGGPSTLLGGLGTGGELFVSPDSRHVLYDGPVNTANKEYLTAVIGQAGTESVLSPAFANSTGPAAVLFSPDSEWVVLRIGFGLYSGRVDGSGGIAGFVALNPATPSEPVGAGFRITTDSSRVIYDHAGILYSHPIDGSAPPLVLGNSTAFDTSPVEPSVVYSEFPSIWKVPADGSAAPVSIGSFAPDGDVAVTPDGAHVTYLDGRNRRSIRTDGSTGSPVSLTKLNSPFFEEIRSWEVSQDGRRFVFDVRDDDFAGFSRLQATPIDKTSDDLALVDTMSSTLRIDEFRLVPDGSRAIVRGNLEMHGTTALYTVDIGPTVRRLQPRVGQADQLVPILVRGSGFLPGVEVTFGGFPAAAVQFVDPSTLAVLPPTPPIPLPSGASSKRVRVRVSDGVVTSADPAFFEYVFPEVLLPGAQQSP